jgi:hypothetical protein
MPTQRREITLCLSEVSEGPRRKCQSRVACKVVGIIGQDTVCFVTMVPRTVVIGELPQWSIRAARAGVAPLTPPPL